MPWKVDEKLIAASLFIGAAIFATAQTPQPALNSDQRINTILGYVHERTTDQNNIWFDEGDYPRSIESLQVLHLLFPHDYELTTDLGWMLENIDDNDDALKIYVGYRDNYPEDPEAAYPEAEFYFRKRLWAKVPPIIEPSLKLSTRPHPNSYRILARSYEQLKLFTDAKRIWDTYLAFAPNDGQAKANRLRVISKMKPTPTAS